MEIKRFCIVTSYQNIMLSVIKTTSTTAAQKMGRFNKGNSPSEGNGVQPLTNPTNCDSGFGFVNRLTITVTDAVIIQHHNALYIFSAISLACAESAIIFSAAGSIFTQSHMPTEETIPASNPQKPPAAVVRFHSIPKITVPNIGATKKLNNAWT